MRVFIAIDVPDAIKKNIVKVQSDLKKSGVFIGNWTKDYHFTLKFLGDVSDEKIELIKKIKLETKEFELEVKGFGAFPSENFIRVIWIGSDSKELKQLQTEIENKLALLGFEKDAREFGGHLTLCRVKRFYKNQANTLFEKYKNYSFGKFKVKVVKLFESKLTPLGPVYSLVKEFKLTY